MKIVKDEPSHQYLFRDENPGFMDKIFLTKYERNDHDLWMFNQDFTNLFRSQNQSMDNLFSIDSNDKELTEKLFQNIQTRYSPYSVDGTIRELVKEIAQSLICFGSSYYFLHIETDGIPFRLVPINAETVFCLLGVYFQYIPKRIERNWDQDDKELSREIRILDRDKLICFNIPGTLKLILSKQNRILTTLYKHQFKEDKCIPLSLIGNPSPTNYFEYTVWRNIRERALYRATRKTGWNCRKFDSPNISDFFHCHRLIQFRRNQLLLRDHILVQLSKEIARIGRHDNPEFQITISLTDVLPTINELNELESRLSNEDVDFREVVDFYFKR